MSDSGPAYPGERWRRLPVVQLHPQMLIMGLHDISWDDVALFAKAPVEDPIWVDGRTGELRIADGRHRAIAACWRNELVPARLLTLGHQP